MTLQDLIQKDNAAVIFSAEDLGEVLEVRTSSRDGVSCLGSLQSNAISLTANPGRGVPLRQFEYTLFLKAEDAKRIHARTGAPIFVDGEAYEVVDSTVELGVWQGNLRGGRAY